MSVLCPLSSLLPVLRSLGEGGCLPSPHLCVLCVLCGESSRLPLSAFQLFPQPPAAPTESVPSVKSVAGCSGCSAPPFRLSAFPSPRPFIIRHSIFDIRHWTKKLAGCRLLARPPRVHPVGESGQNPRPATTNSSNLHEWREFRSPRSNVRPNPFHPRNPQLSAGTSSAPSAASVVDRP